MVKASIVRMRLPRRRGGLPMDEGAGLREREERLCAVLEAVRECILTITDTGTIAAANTAVERVFGYAPEEVLGRHISFLMAADLVEHHDDCLAQYLACSNADGAKCRMTGRRRDGTSITVELSVSEVLIEGHRSLVCVMDDVSERAAAERALVEARNAAEQSDRAKSQFLANMSHEFRTPLNAILGFAQLMQQEALGPLGTDTYRDYCDNILTSGEHLLAMIENLLDASRLHLGSYRLVEEERRLADLVAETLSITRAKAAQCGVAIVPPDLSGAPLLRLDPLAFRQVLINVLDNAIKFSDRGGEIRLAWSADDRDVALSVTDRGRGIPADQLASVLRPFHQCDPFGADAARGVGLGLAISNDLVRLHGGGLAVDSTPGEGTVVTIRLPVHRLVRQAAAEPERRAAS